MWFELAFSAIFTAALFAGIWLGYRMAKLAERQHNPIKAIVPKVGSVKAYTDTQIGSASRNDDDTEEEPWPEDELAEGIPM